MIAFQEGDIGWLESWAEAATRLVRIGGVDERGRGKDGANERFERLPISVR